MKRNVSYLRPLPHESPDAAVMSGMYVDYIHIMVSAMNLVQRTVLPHWHDREAGRVDGPFVTGLYVYFGWFRRGSYWHTATGRHGPVDAQVPSGDGMIRNSTSKRD